ncbi:MAG: hypothetical protein ABI858_02375 [Pseudoxanthomonas sp.]
MTVTPAGVATLEPRRGHAMAVAFLSASTAYGTVFADPFEVGGTDTRDGWALEVESVRLRSGDEVIHTHPALGLTLGFGKRFELAIGSGYGIAEFDGGERRSGSHDLELAFKWMLRPESYTSVGIAIEPELSVPTGDRAAGMGEGDTLLELPLRVSGSFGHGRVTGQGSWLHAKRSGKSAWSAGVLYEQQVARDLWLGAEAMHEQNLDAGADTSQRGSVGFRWQPHGQWEVSGGYRRSWRHGAGGVQSSVQLGIEFQFD